MGLGERDKSDSRKRLPWTGMKTIIIVSAFRDLQQLGPRSIVYSGLVITLLNSVIAIYTYRAKGKKLILIIRYKAEFKRKIKASYIVLYRA